MTRVAVSGAAGRMGRLVAAGIAAADDLDLVAAYDPAHPGTDAGGVEVTADPAAVGAAEVVVEFTRPDVVMANLADWQRLGVHAVVGTSGFDADRIAAAVELFGSGPPNCLIAPNFSIGAVLMMHFAEQAAPHFTAAEIVEMHHDRKSDAPSGTALATARRMRPGGRRHVESEELAAGARGADVEGVTVHAVRLPGLLAHQLVVLGHEGETLTIRHDTTDRASFLPGVLLAVRNVGSLPGVTVGIEGLLGLA